MRPVKVAQKDTNGFFVMWNFPAHGSMLGISGHTHQLWIASPNIGTTKNTSIDTQNTSRGQHCSLWGSAPQRTSCTHHPGWDHRGLSHVPLSCPSRKLRSDLSRLRGGCGACRLLMGQPPGHTIPPEVASKDNVYRWGCEQERFTRP